MVWQGGIEDDHFPVILDVIYSDEFDKEELVREAHTASINGWRFNSETGAIDCWPEDGRFRRADGSAGPCQFELTVSDFLPDTDSNEETDATIINFDMDEMREVLREDEKIHDDQLRRLKNQHPSTSDGPGSGKE
ncbi:hypothetical protein LTR27_001795 [Elasticomyces elasticus]|nr:hypothetical protein LTR27_001795 [Elasticomyces elasticus]